MANRINIGNSGPTANVAPAARGGYGIKLEFRANYFESQRLHGPRPVTMEPKVGRARGAGPDGAEV